MKRYHYFYNWLAAVIIMLCCTNAVSAQTTEIMDNGIRYSLNINDKTAQVLPNDCNYSGDIIIPETVAYEGTEYTITSLGYKCFEGCINLVSVNMPDGITSLEKRCFAGCPLTSITLPKGITSLPDSCFWYSSSLANVKLPEGITSLGYECFSNCI